MTVAQGTVLTCTNTECGCRLQVQEPCPHGDGYTCACGHALVPAGDGDDGTIPPTPGA
ncbi:MAG TPA: hypothetical protein VK507_13855 [Iamia sp.]|nr:hypothetical protein [Iamia sp.]